MPNREPSILYIGTPELSVIVLKRLLKQGFNVVGVLTQPDQRAGRYKKIAIAPLKLFALKNQLKVIEADAISSETIEAVKELKPELAILAAFGVILPRNFIDLFPLGILNLHPSMLPLYRGPSPVQAVLLDGSNETGVTIIKLNERMDAGDIIAQQKVKIADKDNYSSLSEKLFLIGARMLEGAIIPYCQAKIQVRSQDEKSATYTKIVRREYGLVCFDEESLKIFNKWRAYHPWPGIYANVSIKGVPRRVKLIEISQSEIERSAYRQEDRGFKKIDNRLAIVAKDGILFVDELQLDGKRKMRSEEFLQGYSNVIQ